MSERWPMSPEAIMEKRRQARVEASKAQSAVSADPIGDVT